MSQPASRSAQRGPSSGRGAGATVAWTLTAGIAALLIALTWISAVRVIRSGRVAAEHHAAEVAAAQADVIAAALDRQLSDSDLLLQLLARRWRADPAGFNLADWFRAPSALPTGVGVFLLDRAGVVRQASQPGGAGRDPGRAATLAALGRALARQPDAALPQLAIGQVERGRDGASGSIDLTRALRTATGTVAGALVMALPARHLLASGVPAVLAPRSLVVLVETGGGHVRAAIRLATPSHPGLAPDADIAAGFASAALQAAAAPGARGSGVGPLVPGGPAIVYGFRRLNGLPLALLVGLGRADVLRAPRVLAAETRRFALAISALIVLAALVVLGEIEAMRRRERRLARDRGALAAANAALAGAKRDADAKTAQLEGLLAGLPDGVVMLDPGLRLMAWNRQVADIAGIPPRVLQVGVTLEALLRAQAEAGEFGPVDPEAEVARRVAPLRAGKPVARDERPRPDGRFIELRRKRLPDGGFVTLFSDITARKQAEVALREARAAAEAATAGKSRLVAMVSHEIRTPLQALLHGIELLGGAPLDPMFRRMLAGMRQAGGSMLRLLEDILDVSRMEAGRLALHPERCDPRRPLERAVEMLRPIAAERRVLLALEVAADVPAAILVDPARLQQVAVNLLSNAAKFSRPGLVRLCAGLAPGPVLLVAVTDQGPAITPAQRSLLFQPFSRLDPSGQDAAGVGLGLAICRDLVALMGGDIGCSAGEVAGNPVGTSVQGAGPGNVFWFTLPLAEAAAGPAAAPRPAGAMARGAWRRARLRILLVEDVAVTRLASTALLRREGHAVSPVADGAAAVQAAARGAYDVVLMDVQLPGLDGLAATRAIRALPGAAGAVPIIGLTGCASSEACAACLVAGMGEVLAKPAGRAVLLTALARHAGMSRAPAAIFGVELGAEGAVLSEPRLRELRENLAPATLALVAEECLTGLAELLGRLRHAMVEHDIAAASAAAHAMVGLAGGYGLAAVERAVRATLGALRAGRLDDAAMHGAGLEAELARAADGLRQALRSEAV